MASIRMHRKLDSPSWYVPKLISFKDGVGDGSSINRNSMHSRSDMFINHEILASNYPLVCSYKQCVSKELRC
jgi:hypothetical protein